MVNLLSLREFSGSFRLLFGLCIESPPQSAVDSGGDECLGHRLDWVHVLLVEVLKGWFRHDS